MSALDCLREFRAGVAPPAPSVWAAARAELLSAAEPAASSPTRRGRSVRRLGAAVAAGAVVAVSAVIVSGLVDSAPGVIERAAAAIDPGGRVLHVVVRIEAAAGSVTRGESWVRPDGTGRSLDLSGPGTGDCLASAEELRCYDPARNVVDVYRYYPAGVEAGKRFADLPGYRVDQPESIHRAFTSGYARLRGETTLGGRAVHEIQLAVPFLDASGKATPQFDEATSPILYLDAETYVPVAERFPDSGSTTYYETYEFLPDDAQARRLLELPTRPGFKVVVHPVGEGPQG